MTNIPPPDEDDKRRAAANYLHFENEDPQTCDFYFDSFDQAIEFVNNHGWSFRSEDWEPYGMFEFRIECQDKHGSFVGQLLMLTIKLE